MVSKRSSRSKPGSIPAAPPSPPPPRPATPETIAEVARRVEVLIGHIQEYEGRAERAQRAPRVSAAMAFAQTAGAAQVVEAILAEMHWCPSSPFIYGPLVPAEGEWEVNCYWVMGELYEVMSAARLARHADTFAERQRILADWGKQHSGGWDLIGGEPLPQLGQLQSALEALVRRLREATGQSEEAAPTPPQPLPIIYWLGHKIYRVGDSRPYEVNDDEHAILQAFMRRPAMGEKALKSETNNSDARIILIRLLDKFDGIFSAAILRPPGKSSGGYAATVRKAEQS